MPLYSPWIDRPTFPYVGEPQHIRQMRVTHQRRLRGPQTKIRWNRDWQALAFRRGFFVHRENKTERVVLRPFAVETSLKKSGFNRLEHDVSPETNLALLTAIERETFRGDTFYTHVRNFIEQQDNFGWYGCWTEDCLKLQGPLALQWMRWRARKVKLAKIANKDVYISVPSIVELWHEL